MKLSRFIPNLACLLAVCVAMTGQTADAIHGHVFRSETIGLTFTIPESFSAKVESELPMHDSTGREHMILALWSKSDHSESPRIAFLYDRKVRPADRSRAEIANRYLAEIRQMWSSVRGVKIAAPQKIVHPGCELWRLDLFQPDNAPHYNSAIVIPLADRRVLAIQINAPSQSELDEEVDSLRELRLDHQ